MLMARIAAILEKDLKKIVALSTLRQLGFICYSLSLGAAGLTVIHIITHAFAKANLFLVVGGVIFRSFSEQDSRKTQPALGPRLVRLRAAVRVVRLSGLVFTSGFFSKEQILIRSRFYKNSIAVLILF